MEGTRWSLLSCGAVCAALLVAGCGGGERQDANEPEGTYEVEVVDASFPTKQVLAKQNELAIEVRNTGQEALPNVAVTVDSFARASEQAGLADPERPVWIVDTSPKGGTTAYTNTWALGALAAGQSKTFTWRVTPVRAGTHRVKYRVAAGLNGKAKAVVSGGAEPAGEFVVDVSDKPAQARVNPETGEVEREDEKD
jgi:hypothetical protein